ncbi:MAG: ERF family protein [Eubacteriales bacterium]|nr:ERF family protein [Eubacteriales bacterium]
MNVHEKLLHVQQNLKASKNQYNRFGEFYYRSCEDIQEAVKPLLAEVKAVLLICDDVVLVGSRFYIKATAKFQDTESPDCITNTAYARENEEKPKMDAAQITGSCSSYARKYALNGLFCIDDAKDPDCPQGQQDNKKQSGKKTRQTERKLQISNADLNELRKEAERTGTSLKKVCARYLVNDISELSREQYLRAMSAFSKMETLPPPAPDGQYEMDLSGMETPFR